MGRDSTPLGNGKTGALVAGWAAKEEIILTSENLAFRSFIVRKTIPTIAAIIKTIIVITKNIL
jgi:hypothetical protein